VIINIAKLNIFEIFLILLQLGVSLDSSLDFRMRGYPSTEETSRAANYETAVRIAHIRGIAFRHVGREGTSRGAISFPLRYTFTFSHGNLSSAVFSIPPPLCLPSPPPSVEIHRVYDAVSPPSSLERTWVLFRLSPVGSARLIAICLSPRLSFSFSRVAPRDLHRDSCPAANL